MAETPSTIEHDIAELEKQLAEKKAVLGHEKSEKEILHQAVGEKIQQHAPSYAPSPKQNTSGPVATEPPSYLTQDLKDKVQELISLVFDKNLEEGIKEAVKSDNPALIDAFHDILVDELYSQLVEKKKIDKLE
jgi:hypothetical protein